MSARFFIDQDQKNDEFIHIQGEELIHLQRVLRLGPGDAIVACDNTGMEYQAILQEVGRETARAKIIHGGKGEGEPRLAITLVQGLPKGDKMDYVVQKGTEIGISAFIPVTTERTIVRLGGAGASRKVDRWRRIAHEAAKQSRRSVIPKIYDPMALGESLALYKKRAGVARGLFPWELDKAHNIKDVLAGACRPPQGQPGEVWVFIGPEGGWSHDEVEQAGNAGIIAVTLGPRILRTETAGLVVAALVLYEGGDMAVGR